jgi:hypothetical protein
MADVQKFSSQGSTLIRQYGITNTHKTGATVRFIVSTIETPTYGVKKHGWVYSVDIWVTACPLRNLPVISFGTLMYSITDLSYSYFCFKGCFCEEAEYFACITCDEHEGFPIS